jgi:ParB family chromosome partitioning protein
MNQPSQPPPLPHRTRTRTSPQRAGGFGAITARDGTLRELPLDAITPNPRQPRRHFPEADLEALAASIRERGVLQPVIVRPTGPDTYQLIAGERRWRASRLAARRTIPALIRDTDATHAAELALIENLARRDLTPIEEARALRALIDHLGTQHQHLAARLARSPSDLTNTLKLLDLPDTVIDLIDHGQLTKGHGKLLRTEPNPERCHQLAHRAATEQWPVRRLAHAIADPPPKPPVRAAPPPAHRIARDLSARLQAQTLATTATVRATGSHGFVIRLQAADLEHAEAIVHRLTPPAG